MQFQFFGLRPIFGFVFCTMVQVSTVEAGNPFLAPVIVDSAGKNIGPLITPSLESIAASSVGLSVSPGRPPISVPLTRTSFIPALDSQSPVTVGWRLDNCAGPAFMNARVPLQAAVLNTLPDTLWYPSAAATPKQITIESQITPSGCGGSLFFKPVFPFAVPAKRISVSSFGFTPPFSLKLEDASFAGRPYAFDSTGKVIGPVLGRGEAYLDGLYSVVALRLQPTGAIVILSIRPGGFGPPKNLRNKPFYYTSSDCTGQTYDLQDDNYPVVFGYIDFRDKKNIMYPDNKKMRVRIRSYIIREYPRCEQIDETAELVPIQSVAISAQGFKPPFKVKLEYQ